MHDDLTAFDQCREIHSRLDFIHILLLDHECVQFVIFASCHTDIYFLILMSRLVYYMGRSLLVFGFSLDFCEFSVCEIYAE